MMNHGGVFENYFSSQRVTHIICSTLPDSKIMNPRYLWMVSHGKIGPSSIIAQHIVIASAEHLYYVSRDNSEKLVYIKHLIPAPVISWRT